MWTAIHHHSFVIVPNDPHLKITALPSYRSAQANLQVGRSPDSMRPDQVMTINTVVNVSRHCEAYATIDFVNTPGNIDLYTPEQGFQNT